MKKQLLPILLTLLMSMVGTKAVKAQERFDEVDLMGTWYIASPMPKTFPFGIKKFDGIHLGYIKKGTRYYSGCFLGFEASEGAGTKDEEILDFFISNNNKLHIIFNDDYCLRFIIERMTDSVMNLLAYDNSYSLMLIKDSSSTNVRSAGCTFSEETTTYNLSGQKIEKNNVKGIYIQGGQKKIK